MCLAIPVCPYVYILGLLHMDCCGNGSGIHQTSTLKFDECKCSVTVKRHFIYDSLCFTD